MQTHLTSKKNKILKGVGNFNRKLYPCELNLKFDLNLARFMHYLVQIVQYRRRYSTSTQSIHMFGVHCKYNSAGTRVFCSPFTCKNMYGNYLIAELKSSFTNIRRLRLFMSLELRNPTKISKFIFIKCVCKSKVIDVLTFKILNILNWSYGSNGCFVTGRFVVGSFAFARLVPGHSSKT